MRISHRSRPGMCDYGSPWSEVFPHFMRSLGFPRIPGAGAAAKCTAWLRIPPVGARMVRPNAVLVLLSVLALPAPAAAIVVHGLSHAPLGAATVGEAGTTEGLALSIDNIG